MPISVAAKRRQLMTVERVAAALAVSMAASFGDGLGRHGG